MRDDELLDLFGQLDPARTEDPPAPGSSRYTAIKEQAMSTTTTRIEESRLDLDTTTPRTRRPLRRWRFVAAAAAVAVAVGVGVLRPGNEPSADATVAAAADELAEVTSLRSDMQSDNAVFGQGSSTIAVSGDDYESVWETSTDGGPVESERIVVVDDVEYRTDSTGQTTARPVDDVTDAGSFAEASAAIVRAVVQDADFDEMETEEIRGVEATHYRAEIEDFRGSALGAASDQHGDPFGLVSADYNENGLDQDVTVDIWIADGLVQRFDVSSPDYGSQSIEFYDFNADITIVPPPGPYAEPPTNG